MTITDDEERGGRSDRADYGTDDGDDDEDEEKDGRVKNELHAPPKDGDTYLRKTNPDIGVKVYAANHPRLSFDVPFNTTQKPQTASTADETLSLRLE